MMLHIEVNTWTPYFRPSANTKMLDLTSRSVYNLWVNITRSTACVCFFPWESQAVLYSAHPLCWSGWEISPTTHRGAARKDGAEIPWGWSLPECFTSSACFNVPPLFLIIQWRRQRHLTWSAPTMLWAEKLISGKVATSCWDRTCDPGTKCQVLNR